MAVNTQSLNQESDFEVSALRTEPVGGQQVGVRPVAVKVLHKPTGIYAVCENERSQHKNRSVAMAMVQYGLAEMGWNV
jgi:peptide chain release factor 2